MRAERCSRKPGKVKCECAKMSTEDDAEVAVELPGELAAIDRAQSLVDEFCELEGVPGAARAYLGLVLEELITNSVQHGGANGPAAIVVALRLTNQAVELSYADNGMPFDPRVDAPPDPRATLAATAKVGGLGWPLIFHYLELASYRREGGRNLLSFRARAS